MAGHVVALRDSRLSEVSIDVSKTSAKVTPVQSILRHINPISLPTRCSRNAPHSLTFVFRFPPTIQPPICHPFEQQHLSSLLLPTCLSSGAPQSPRNPSLTKRATRSGLLSAGPVCLEPHSQKTSIVPISLYRKHDSDCYPSSDSCTSTLLREKLGRVADHLG